MREFFKCYRCPTSHALEHSSCNRSFIAYKAYIWQEFRIFSPLVQIPYFVEAWKCKPRASEQVLHLMKIFINTQGSCLEVFRLFSAFLSQVSVNVDCSWLVIIAWIQVWRCRRPQLLSCQLFVVYLFYAASGKISVRAHDIVLHEITVHFSSLVKSLKMLPELTNHSSKNL